MATPASSIPYNDYKSALMVSPNEVSGDVTPKSIAGMSNVRPPKSKPANTSLHEDVPDKRSNLVETTPKGKDKKSADRPNKDLPESSSSEDPSDSESERGKRRNKDTRHRKDKSSRRRKSDSNRKSRKHRKRNRNPLDSDESSPEDSKSSDSERES